MKITEVIRKYLADFGVAEEETLKRRVKAQSKGLLEKGEETL